MRISLALYCLKRKWGLQIVIISQLVVNILRPILLAPAKEFEDAVGLGSVVVIGPREMMPPVFHGAIPPFAAGEVKTCPRFDLDWFS
jgi:hypothetical protein